jgi:hypothetical protein
MVIAETAYLLDRELGPRVEALLFQSILDEQLRIEAFTIADWQRIHDLVIQYADLRLGGTDAGLAAKDFAGEARSIPGVTGRPASRKGL